MVQTEKSDSLSTSEVYIPKPKEKQDFSTMILDQNSNIRIILFHELLRSKT